MVFDLRWMGLPLSTHNPSAAQQVLTLLRSQMPTRSVPGEVAAAVERLLRAQLPQDPKLAGIAAQLHVSERTLRRQLTGEGTSFHEIHDRVRIDQAYALLRDRHVSIASVGDLQIITFTQATPRVEGVPPGASVAALDAVVLCRVAVTRKVAAQLTSLMTSYAMVRSPTAGSA